MLAGKKKRRIGGRKREGRSRAALEKSMRGDGKKKGVGDSEAGSFKRGEGTS